MADRPSRRRRVWHAISAASAALLAVCLVGWGVSLFRGDMVFLRLTQHQGIGIVSLRHRVAFGWWYGDAIPGNPGARLRWQPLPASVSVLRGRWAYASSNSDETYVLFPWAVPVAVLAGASLVARGRARRDAAKAFDVLPAAAGAGGMRVETPPI